MFVVPDGRIEIADADGLEEALMVGIIDRRQYELAWREALALVAAVNGQCLPVLELASSHRQQLLRELAR